MQISFKNQLKRSQKKKNVEGRSGHSRAPKPSASGDYFHQFVR